MNIEIAALEAKEIIKGYKAKFIHTETMTIAFWEVTAGAVMPVHQHIHEQISQVIAGEFELTIGDESCIYSPGQVAIISPGTPHGGVAVTDCRLLDIFSPVREDYKI